MKFGRKALAIGQAGVFPIVMANDSKSEPGGAPVVFVVDDDPSLLELAELVLAPAGFQVRTFRDPRKALTDYARSKPPPGLVVTDYAMGGLSGLDLIRECRRLYPRQKTLLISGTVDEHIYADAPAKPDGFLAKPFDTDQFIAIARQLTGESTKPNKTEP